MNAYLFSVSGAVIIGGIATCVLSDGKLSSTLKRIIRLFCLVVILSPIADFFVKFKNRENFSYISETSVIKEDLSFIDYCCSERKAEAEVFLERAVFEKFGVDSKIRLTLSENRNGKIEITDMQIVLNSETVEQDEIVEFLQREYGIKTCEVINER